MVYAVQMAWLVIQSKSRWWSHVHHEPLDWDRGLQWAQAVLKSHLELSYADFRKVRKCLRQGNQLRRSGPEMIFSGPRWVERCGWFRGCLDFCCGSRNGGASAMRSILDIWWNEICKRISCVSWYLNHLVYSDHISEFHPKKNYKSSGPCAALLPALKELPLKSLGPRTLTLTTESNRSSSAVSAHGTTERVSASVAAKKEIWLTHVFIGQETGPGSNSRNTDGQNWKVLQSSASSLIYTLNYIFEVPNTLP